MNQEVIYFNTAHEAYSHWYAALSEALANLAEAGKIELEMNTKQRIKGDYVNSAVKLFMADAEIHIWSDLPNRVIVESKRIGNIEAFCELLRNHPPV